MKDKKKSESQPEQPVLPKTLAFSAELVQDLINHLGTRPLGEVLPLFQRFSAELRGQLPGPAPQAS